MIRKFIIVVLMSTAMGIGFLLFIEPTSPFIIFAWGYDNPHVLEPLTEYDGGMLSFFMNKKRTRSNWDGEWLYVDGFCGVCGKPYAPRGSFVVANLPKGVAYSHYDGDRKYAHMSGLIYVQRSTLCSLAVLLALYPAVAFIRGPFRHWQRKRKSLCTKCGYDLTGNESGICSECGSAVKG